MNRARLTPRTEAAFTPGRGLAPALHVITGLEVGGAETALLRLLRVTRQRGSRAMVVTLRGGGALERDIRALGFPVLVLRHSDRACPSKRNGLAAICRACRDFRPAVVVGWMYHGIALGWLLRLLVARACPLVWNVRCTLDGLALWPRSTQLLIRVLRSLSGSASVIVYNSVRGRDQHATYGFSNVRARVIDNGVDVLSFTPDSAARVRVREALGVPRDAVVIGHVARFDPLKGHDVFLEALAHMAVSGAVHVVMAGRQVTRDNPALRERMESLHPRISVHALGERRDVAELMRAFDVFCLSSNSEGFPNVVVEAMACGVPCVVTDAGDASRIVGATGRCVASGDAGAVARALEELCSMRREDREELGRAASQRVRESFSTEHMADQFADAFSGPSDRIPDAAGSR